MLPNSKAEAPKAKGKGKAKKVVAEDNDYDDDDDYGSQAPQASQATLRGRAASAPGKLSSKEVESKVHTHIHTDSI